MDILFVIAQDIIIRQVIIMYRNIYIYLYNWLNLNKLSLNIKKLIFYFSI